MTQTFELRPRGPFSLTAAAGFLDGFSPIAGTAGQTETHLHLAFVPEGETEAAGVCLRTEGDAVIGDVYGHLDGAAVREAVARILTLDLDGSGYPDVGRHDAVAGELQARYPGLRPVHFFSPFEAAAWALISQRVQMTQAARIKARMAEQLGAAVDIHGDRRHAFPAPARLMEVDDFPGLFGRKGEYLQQLSHAAFAGRLDTARLRSMSEDEALADLKGLPGVGEFSSRLILLRGAGYPDGSPAREPRTLRALSVAYGLDHIPTDEEVTTISERWRPYRPWVIFLLRKMLADEGS